MILGYKIVLFGGESVISLASSAAIPSLLCFGVNDFGALVTRLDLNTLNSLKQYCLTLVERNELEWGGLFFSYEQAVHVSKNIFDSGIDHLIVKCYLEEDCVTLIHRLNSYGECDLYSSVIQALKNHQEGDTVKSEEVLGYIWVLLDNSLYYDMVNTDLGKLIVQSVGLSTNEFGLFPTSVCLDLIEEKCVKQVESGVWTQLKLTRPIQRTSAGQANGVRPRNVEN